MQYNLLNDIEKIVMKKWIASKISEIMIDELDIDADILYQYRNTSAASQNMQAGVIKADTDDKYDYVMRFFECEWYNTKSIMCVAGNIMMSTIHEFRHIHQMETDMFPDMKHGRPESPWEIDADEYTIKFYTNNKDYLDVKIVLSVDT